MLPGFFGIINKFQPNHKQKWGFEHIRVIYLVNEFSFY